MSIQPKFLKTIILFLPIVAASFASSSEGSQAKKWFDAVQEGRDFQVLSMLTKCPANEKFNLLSMESDCGVTALHIAAARGHLNIVKILLHNCPKDKVLDFISMEADVFGKKTALSLAKKNAHFAIEKKLSSIKKEQE